MDSEVILRGWVGAETGDVLVLRIERNAGSCSLWEHLKLVWFAWSQPRRCQVCSVVHMPRLERTDE